METVSKISNSTLISQKQHIQRLILDYYQSPPFPFEPTETDLKTWLKTLCRTEQEIYQWMGLDTCRHMLAFRRFYFRQRNYRLESYMASRLSVTDFKIWLSM